MKASLSRCPRVTLAVVAAGLALINGSLHAATAEPVQTTPPPPAPNCPQLGWSEGLGKYQTADAAFPTEDTAQLPTPDCNFHQWSWEAFAWATALVADPASGATIPRFMTLPTPDDLLSSDANATQPRVRALRLGARSAKIHGTAGFSEGAGAIVEADGNMLVSQNGYPVYASVHMNSSYFGLRGAEQHFRDVADGDGDDVRRGAGCDSEMTG